LYQDSIPSFHPNWPQYHEGDLSGEGYYPIRALMLSGENFHEITKG